MIIPVDLGILYQLLQRDQFHQDKIHINLEQFHDNHVYMPSEVPLRYSMNQVVLNKKRDKNYMM